MSARAVIWNYGGGTQSVAIAVLVAQGALPTPERIVMAKLPREMPRVFTYYETHVRPLLAQVGREVEFVLPDSQTPGDYYQRIDGSIDDTPLTPGFTAQGRLPALCSGHWKRDRITRWLREQGYGPKRPIVQWVGYSVDERRRVAKASRARRAQWAKLAFPLFTMVPLRREHCARLIALAGLPPAPRSRCYDCANQRNDEWREVRDTEPELFQLAVRRDHEMRARDPRGDLYLHHSAVPLDEADLSEAAPPPFFDAGCDSAGCYT